MKNVDVKFPKEWHNHKMLMALIQFFFEREGYHAFVCPSSVNDIIIDPELPELKNKLIEFLIEKTI